MAAESSQISKPRSDISRADLTRLPELAWWRILLRHAFRWIARLLVFVATKTEVRGMEKMPKKRPALIVSNHLGDADWIVGIAFSPVFAETMAKVELYYLPVVGTLLDAYGVIWVHRGQPDRKALRAALKAFEEGRIVAIAPEGRESLTGALEEGTGGAAYLALKGNVPVIPLTITGTENAIVFRNLKQLKRTEISVVVGDAFRLEVLPTQRQSLDSGTETIMRKLADQLPPKYRGVYQ